MVAANQPRGPRQEDGGETGTAPSVRSIHGLSSHKPTTASQQDSARHQGDARDAIRPAAAQRGKPDAPGTEDDAEKNENRCGDKCQHHLSLLLVGRSGDHEQGAADITAVTARPTHRKAGSRVDVGVNGAGGVELVLGRNPLLGIGSLLIRKNLEPTRHHEREHAYCMRDPVNVRDHRDAFPCVPVS